LKPQTLFPFCDPGRGALCPAAVLLLEGLYDGWSAYRGWRLQFEARPICRIPSVLFQAKKDQNACNIGKHIPAPPVQSIPAGRRDCAIRIATCGPAAKRAPRTIRHALPAMLRGCLPQAFPPTELRCRTAAVDDIGTAVEIEARCAPSDFIGCASCLRQRWIATQTCPKQKLLQCGDMPLPGIESPMRSAADLPDPFCPFSGKKGPKCPQHRQTHPRSPSHNLYPPGVGTAPSEKRPAARRRNAPRAQSGPHSPRCCAGAPRCTTANRDTVQDRRRG
jgi:hypothetical protein